ncbi:uncharacterized protein GGS22DRAFT_186732 [Annulohypoxylon maeteangense]|uniref:uncharacterized protein n=1 Tax=Annulohypoxylon maeteangense TaxID=1927788 RepID=UPI00200794DF|nr:uncharacterized protein GGS22DRAFT_186732 [Annulohypoxylon maeteangense]KAI0886659.1 hypothetical protein GGS22DRAFT_186732 [Annulohypoxylon maeteangense]
MSIYPKFCNELKLEVWDQAAMIPGMHYFQLYVDRYADAMPLGDINTQTPQLMPAEPEAYDPSAWRQRSKLMEIDAASERAIMGLFRRPSSKKMWPRMPFKDTPKTKDRAFILRDLDMICIQFIGRVTASWVRPVRNQHVFAGIKQVSMEYDYQYIDGVYKDPPFQCRGDLPRRCDLKFCPLLLDKFISYFPDMKKFFFIMKLTLEHLRPIESVQITTGKRDHEGNFKNEGNNSLLTQPRMTRKQASAYHLKSTYENFRDTARRENLASFEDMEHFYYEVRKCDSHVLTVHDEFWRHFRKLEELWAAQERTPNLGHRINKVELGLLIFVDQKDINPLATRPIKSRKATGREAASWPVIKAPV